jgi:hypothetical protein
LGTSIANLPSIFDLLLDGLDLPCMAGVTPSDKDSAHLQKFHEEGHDYSDYKTKNFRSTGMCECARGTHSGYSTTRHD